MANNNTQEQYRKALDAAREALTKTGATRFDDQDSLANCRDALRDLIDAIEAQRPVAWCWEERQYSGGWGICYGIRVSEYENQSQWVRNAAPLYFYPPAGEYEAAPVATVEQKHRIKAMSPGWFYGFFSTQDIPDGTELFLTPRTAYSPIVGWIDSAGVLHDEEPPSEWKARPLTYAGEAPPSSVIERDAVLKVLQLFEENLKQRWGKTENPHAEAYGWLLAQAQCMDISKVKPAKREAETVDAWKPSEEDYDRSIHFNPDAKAWADLFVQTYPGLADKHDVMLGWFANAMMAMHDHIKAQSSPVAVSDAALDAAVKGWTLDGGIGLRDALRGAIERGMLAAAKGEVEPVAVPVAVPEEWRDAAQEFVDRVERGKIRSKRTYAKFKALLAAANGTSRDHL